MSLLVFFKLFRFRFPALFSATYHFSCSINVEAAGSKIELGLFHIPHDQRRHTMPTTNYASSSKLSSSRAAKNDKNPKDDGNGDDDDLGDNDSGSNALAPRENVSANPSNDLTPGSTSTVPVQSSSTQSPIVVMPSTLVAESDFISPGYTYTIPASIYTLSQNPVVATSSEISQSTPPSVLTSIGTAPTSISTANPNNHTLSLSSKLESSKLTTADKICIAAISVGEYMSSAPIGRYE